MKPAEVVRKDGGSNVVSVGDVVEVAVKVARVDGFAVSGFRLTWNPEELRAWDPENNEPAQAEDIRIAAPLMALRRELGPGVLDVDVGNMESLGSGPVELLSMHFKVERSNAVMEIDVQGRELMGN